MTTPTSKVDSWARSVNWKSIDAIFNSNDQPPAVLSNSHIENAFILYLNVKFNYDFVMIFVSKGSCARTGGESYQKKL